MRYCVNIMLNLFTVLLFRINFSVDLSNMFTKYKFKFVTVSWSWCVCYYLSIIRNIISTVPSNWASVFLLITCAKNPVLLEREELLLKMFLINVNILCLH